jgi:CMP-N-acetylneuraminic acid synthetase
MNALKIAALVPMRHSSERVPGKNYRDFAGKPLFFHIVNSLLCVDSIHSVTIDTDSPKIMEISRELFGDRVKLLERPEHLRDGTIAMNDVLLHALDQIEADVYLQSHSTNPLLSKESINKAVDTFKKVYPMYDSLFTVTERYTRYWDSLARPVNHNQNILLRTQDLPPIFEENSCLYLFTKEILKKKHNRIGDRPYMLPIPEIEAQDIDVELNFKMAEFLYWELNGRSKP